MTVPSTRIADAAALMIQDQNGSAVFSNDKALYGYMDAAKYLVLPHGYLPNFVDPPPLNPVTLGADNSVQQFLGRSGDAHRTNHGYTRNAHLTDLDVMKITLINYVALRAASCEIRGAFVAASLRGRWIRLGCLYSTIATRCVTYDEIRILPAFTAADTSLEALIMAATSLAALDSITNAYLAEFQNFVSDPHWGTEPCVKWAETIWSISEHMFRVRGHHYKPELEGTITNILKAATEGSVTLDNSFEFADVFHTAIHPFGIKALPVMAYHFICHGKVGNALIMRTSGAPNGVAVITTAAACIRSLTGEAWYSRFAATYRVNVESITKYASEILNHKYQYHLAAGLYGVTPLREMTIDGKRKTLAEIDSEISAIAPFLQAFINACSTEASAGGTGAASYSFGNARVLAKRASTNPLLITRVGALIKYTLEVVGSSPDLGTAIRDTFPVASSEASSGGPGVAAITSG